MIKDLSNFGSMVERFRELRFREWVGLSAKRRGRRKLIGPAPFSLGRLLPAEKNWFRLTNEIRTERVPLDSMIRGHFLGARPPRPHPHSGTWVRFRHLRGRGGLVVVVDCAPPLSFIPPSLPRRHKISSRRPERGLPLSEQKW